MSPDLSQQTSPNLNRLHIHGDNILECERALQLLAQGLAPHNPQPTWQPSASYAPIYRLISNTGEPFEVQFFPGYNRWGFNLQEHLQTLGAPLREATDAVITRVTPTSTGEPMELPLLALEFCGALPAGNNAWQRCGRALACAFAGLPYLYIAELGGVELGEQRRVKAPRLPNPLVPFAYLTLGQHLPTMVLPIYIPSPSVEESIAQAFLPCFGNEEACALAAHLVRGTDRIEVVRSLQGKALQTTQLLAKRRRRPDTLRDEEWKDLAECVTGTEKAAWLIRKAAPWRKRITIARRTPSIKKLVAVAIRLGCCAAGAEEMPLCLLPGSARPEFAQSLINLYPGKLQDEFVQWLSSAHSPLILVWVCGFKPAGEDSRPDRGLVPLVRMLFGMEQPEVVTVVYGPARVETWRQLAHDQAELARTNGLWEALLGLSDAILVDSATASDLNPIGFLTHRTPSLPTPGDSFFPATSPEPVWGEQDIDTTLHQLFLEALAFQVFEAMCNPPGGDWSGLSFFSYDTHYQFRWTSLPRVSGTQAKRPDHVIQFLGAPGVLLAIESKHSGTGVEPAIGPRLERYVAAFLALPPNIRRAPHERFWQPYTGMPLAPCPEIITAAAFLYTSPHQLEEVMQRGQVDMVLGLEFIVAEQRTLLHTLVFPKAHGLLPKMGELCERYAGRVEVQVHGLADPI